MSCIDRAELAAVSNHISNIPSIGAVYAPVLVEHCRALLAEVERLRDAHAMAVQVSGELCEKCGWAMKFPGEKCRCELLAEVERLTAELHRMKSRPVEAEFSRLDTMWQQLARERDEAVHELRRLTADPLPAAAWVREVERTAFSRGVAAMRVAALNVIDCDETEWRCHGDLHAERIHALPDPEDTK